MATDSSQKFTDVIVAVHGIGMQRRSETVRSVATRLARSETLKAGGSGQPVAPQPLGYFATDIQSLAAIRLVDDPGVLTDMELATIGFTEVYWSDIPQTAINEGRTLEETKAWARTVVSRARALYFRAAGQHGSIVPPDFGLASEVLDEIVDTVRILENLVFLAGKAGLFQFNLADLLEEYVGDVQLVTEFGSQRGRVLDRFHFAMESIFQQECSRNKDLRIHIVAHSEGTVVSFLGLLEAMSQLRAFPGGPGKCSTASTQPTGSFPPWLTHVAGYMTIGSPIDKHLLLWPRIWNSLRPSLANDLFQKDRKIRWRNYYDLGDPVGFELDSARAWMDLKEINCRAFDFCGCKNCHDDIGFARYFFPGEAHNEYWNDPGVFEHFIKDVVRPREPRPKPPGDHWDAKRLSPTLPYVLCLCLLYAGVFLLFQAVHGYTHPGDNPFQKFVRFRELGLAAPQELTTKDLILSVTGITALIAGVTLLGRFPRLARGGQWIAAGIAACILGLASYCVLVPPDVRNEIGGVFTFLGPFVGGNGPTIAVLALATVGGLIGYAAVRRPAGAPRADSGDADPKINQPEDNRAAASRRERVVLKGTRPLIICGAIVITAIVILQLWTPNPDRFIAAYQVKVPVPVTNSMVQLFLNARLTPDDVSQMISTNGLGTNWIARFPRVASILAARRPVWPMILAGAAFLYLWWLAILLFDLSFAWQWYIRHSITNRRLREWNPYGFPGKDPADGSETCRKKHQEAEAARTALH